MEKIKACPFCGNKSVTLITRRGKDGWRDRFYILCDYSEGGCGASGGWYHYPDEAVAAWNKRTSFSIDEVVTATVLAGQGDTKRFKLGETIRYSPSEIEHILEAKAKESEGDE